MGKSKSGKKRKSASREVAEEAAPAVDEVEVDEDAAPVMEDGGEEAAADDEDEAAHGNFVRDLASLEGTPR